MMHVDGVLQYADWPLLQRRIPAGFWNLNGYRPKLKTSLPKVVRRQSRASTEGFLLSYFHCQLLIILFVLVSGRRARVDRRTFTWLRRLINSRKLSSFLSPCNMFVAVIDRVYICRQYFYKIIQETLLIFGWSVVWFFCATNWCSIG